ncbi:hypothetical protein [Mesorhizobium sp. P5_C1]
MKWLNTNTLHNALNVLIWLPAAIAGFLTATGCTTLASGGFDCAASWLPPQDALWIAAFSGFLKTLINLQRDGLAGLIKPQPPLK